jgi:hypothetical protein
MPYTVGQQGNQLLIQEPFKTTFAREFIAHVVFGFMDNFFMIVFAKKVEDVFGKVFRKKGATEEKVNFLSAGYGNLSSDAVGVVSGRSVASFLTDKVLKLPRGLEVHYWGERVGSLLGVIAGCWIGMHIGIKLVVRKQKKQQKN